MFYFGVNPWKPKWVRRLHLSPFTVQVYRMFFNPHFKDTDHAKYKYGRENDQEKYKDIKRFLIKYFVKAGDGMRDEGNKVIRP